MGILIYTRSWKIGKSIIEEQGGNEKAEYGVGLLKELSKQMTQDFGKDFTVTNQDLGQIQMYVHYYE